MNLLKQLNLDTENSGVSTGISGWLPVHSGQMLSSINPATGAVIAKVKTASHEDYAAVIAESVRAFAKWRLVPAPQRGELVRLIGEELRANKDALGSLVALEMGKIKQEGDGEVQEMIDMADFAVGQSRMLYGKTMHSERALHRMYEQWQPLGPIGVISAFNFPVAVWAWNAFIAAICGDTVIWKPSPKTPLCAIAVQKICERVMARAGHEGVFSLFITQDDTLAAEFVADSRLPLISFTGSVPVGRKVNEIVAKRLGRSLLELSGNNAVIIDESADLQLAIPAIVFGAVGTAGQRCTSLRRLLVHQSLYEPLIAKLIHAYKKIPIGDPLQPNVLMGPLIDQAAVENYQSALSKVREQGGEILYGGRIISGEGYFVEPTLVRAKPDWEIVQRETFAPILYVMSYADLTEAVRIQNAVPQGLSSAIFTENLRNAEYFLSAIGSDCGIANVNIGTSGAEIGGAFGGEKETGGGREAGSDAWKAYMRRQTSTINWGRELPLAQGIKFEV
ncbi:MAG TPA: aldehyde dehydrogenase family protein [Gammaproteobacteria bacterium]|nr:aldehyde dehydrogenase family protein [Gammaproteobacteria bacterium]